MTIGDTAPELAFLRPDGERVPLGSLLTSDFLLLVFLRHLA